MDAKRIAELILHLQSIESIYQLQKIPSLDLMHPMVAKHVREVRDQSRQPIYKAIVNAMACAPDLETITAINDAVKHIASGVSNPKVLMRMKELERSEQQLIEAEQKKVAVATKALRDTDELVCTTTRTFILQCCTKY